jgi:glycosyltransferase 2 family protein
MAVRLADGLSAYRAHGHILGRVAVLSFLVQALRIVLAWVLGQGLGILVPFRYYWVFMPLNILVILLPVSLGGFGLPQGTMVWTLGPLGVEPTAAFLLSSLFVGLSIIGNLPGAWMYLTGPPTPPGAR